MGRNRDLRSDERQTVRRLRRRSLCRNDSLFELIATRKSFDKCQWQFFSEGVRDAIELLGVVGVNLALKCLSPFYWEKYALTVKSKTGDYSINNTPKSDRKL